MTERLKGIVSANPSIQQISKEAKDQGMVTLRQDGVMKALEGLVMFEEVVRETEEV